MSCRLESRFFSRLPRIGGVLVLWVWLAPGARAAAPQYQVQDLGRFRPTGINDLGEVVGGSYLYDGHSLINLTTTYGLTGDAELINNLGQIAGSIRTPNAPDHLFLFSGGTTSLLPDLGGASNAWSMNDSGQVVGTASNPVGSAEFPALFGNGPVKLLSTATGIAYSINQSGQAVFQLPVENDNSYLYSIGTVTTLGRFFATSINNRGQVVGNGGSPNAPVSDVFLYDSGHLTDLGHMTVNGSAYSTFPTFINDSGTIAGYYEITRSLSYPFVYEDGQFYDLHSLLPETIANHVNSVTGLNNAGQIIFSAFLPATSSVEGYLLTPIPEPTAGACVAVWGAILLLRRRRGLGTGRAPVRAAAST